MKPCAAFCLAALVALAACGRADEPSPAHEAHAPAAGEAGPGGDPTPQDVVTIDPEMLQDLRITTALAEARAGADGVTALGEVTVNEDAYAEVGAASAARVVEILASPGERVEVGAGLAVLESAELGRARAALAAARARAGVARRALARKRELAGERIVAGRELHEAEAEASAADAELRAAQGALLALGAGSEADQAGAPIEPRFTLRSPIAGTLLERRAVAGRLAEAGATLFRVGDLRRLWLVVHAFERDAVRVAPGAAVRVGLAALPGRTLGGTVALVGSQVDTGSRTIPIRIEVENADGALRPGMSASAWIPLGDAGETLVAVPAAALQRTQEGWCVFLPRAAGAFEVRPVGRGRDLGGEVEVLSGLAPGEAVVVDGAFLLKAEREKARGEGGHHEH